MTRVPKDGRVIVRYDKREDDISVAWGNGVRQGTPGLVLSAFTNTGIPGADDNPFFRELEKRGFDLSTLKFQIDLKEET